MTLGLTFRMQTKDGGDARHSGVNWAQNVQCTSGENVKGKMTPEARQDWQLLTRQHSGPAATLRLSLWPLNRRLVWELSHAHDRQPTVVLGPEERERENAKAAENTTAGGTDGGRSSPGFIALRWSHSLQSYNRVYTSLVLCWLKKKV